MIDLTFLHTLARGGGGGSGGGGGGGGGGGSGGSGGSGGDGVVGFFFILGYLPVSLVVGAVKKRQPTSHGYLLGVPTAILTTFLVALIFKAWSILTGLGALLGFVGGTSGLNSHIINQIKSAKTKLTAAAGKDKTWDESALRQLVRQTFDAYQADWSSYNYKHMHTYLEPEYFAHMQLVLRALEAMGRRNAVDSAKLDQVEFVEVVDVDDNENDKFEVLISAHATDRLLDTKNGNKQIYQDSSPWKERWVFNRTGSTWRLENIFQLTEQADNRTASLRDFAAANKFFYNADFGWLLLPQRGQLFSLASFINSDVNNHIMGVYRDVLVQFYSYLPYKGRAERYVIAQAVLPKTYGNIVVRQHKGRFNRKIKGLNSISMEAREFNDKYEVFADDVEQVTSFELLHPAFMVKLIELSYEVNIEVVDNVLYLYSTDANTSYDSMLELLKAAFEELKL